MKIVLKYNYVPNTSWNDCQKCDANCEPLLEIMEVGTPCSEMILSKNNCAYCEAMYVVLTVKKYAFLVS